MAKEKKRLDLLIAEQHPNLSRRHVQSLILQGKVAIEGKVHDKPGTPIQVGTTIDISYEEPKYVSRAGYKLEAALKHFGINVMGKVVLDAGLSTGGFTDCLLQNGALKVYGVDVGYGQVHEKLRDNKKLVLMERTNLRHLEELPELVDLVTLDLSFISILKVMPAVAKLIKPDGIIITLIKPQFEAKRQEIARGGVVKDDAARQRAVDKVVDGMEEFGYSCGEVIESPVRGAVSGNIEYLALFEKQ